MRTGPERDSIAKSLLQNRHYSFYILGEACDFEKRPSRVLCKEIVSHDSSNVVIGQKKRKDVSGEQQRISVMGYGVKDRQDIRGIAKPLRYDSELTCDCVAPAREK